MATVVIRFHDNTVKTVKDARIEDGAITNSAPVVGLSGGYDYRYLVLKNNKNQVVYLAKHDVIHSVSVCEECADECCSAPAASSPHLQNYGDEPCECPDRVEPVRPHRVCRDGFGNVSDSCR